MGENPSTDAALPSKYRAWQLHGAGIENVGTDGKPEELDLRDPAENELLLRVDAVGLCLSDIKIIKQGSNHARLRGRDLSIEPTVLGHECSVTVVRVGDRWKNRFEPGERYVIQADIYYNGTGYAFGYVIPGGLGQYTYIDERAIEGDEGCYLIPVEESLGYSQAALCEPWACVEMSYNLYQERTVPGDGRVLVVTDTDISTTFANSVHVPSDLSGLPDGEFDDIVIFAPTPMLVEKLAKVLTKDGVMYLVGDPHEQGTASLDIGRIHYEGVRVYGGGEDLKAIAAANERCDLAPGGAALFVGAGGPMGQMHVQRSLEIPGSPSKVLVTDLDAGRLNHLQARFGSLAEDREIHFETVCAKDYEDDAALRAYLRSVCPEGFDDICILAPVAQLVADYVPLAADNALVNVFAGVVIGSFADIPIEDLCRGIKIMGSSGSRIADMQKILDMVRDGALNTNLSVAAIGGLSAARDGLEGLRDARFPGKTVIYTQIPDLELTALEEIAARVPEVADALGPQGEWTIEAEAALLKHRSQG